MILVCIQGIVVMGVCMHVMCLTTLAVYFDVVLIYCCPTDTNPENLELASSWSATVTVRDQVLFHHVVDPTLLTLMVEEFDIRFYARCMMVTPTRSASIQAHWLNGCPLTTIQSADLHGRPLILFPSLIYSA